MGVYWLFNEAITVEVGHEAGLMLRRCWLAEAHLKWAFGVSAFGTNTNGVSRHISRLVNNRALR